MCFPIQPVTISRNRSTWEGYAQGWYNMTTAPCCKNKNFQKITNIHIQRFKVNCHILKKNMLRTSMLWSHLCLGTKKYSPNIGHRGLWSPLDGIKIMHVELGFLEIKSSICYSIKTYYEGMLSAYSIVSFMQKCLGWNKKSNCKL